MSQRIAPLADARASSPHHVHDRLLPVEAVLQLIPITRPTLSRWEKQGIIPRRLTIGARVFWRESEIMACIARLDREVGDV